MKEARKKSTARWGLEKRMPRCEKWGFVKWKLLLFDELHIIKMPTGTLPSRSIHRLLSLFVEVGRPKNMKH